MESNLQILRPISVLPFCHASCFTTILPPKLFEALEREIEGPGNGDRKHAQKQKISIEECFSKAAQLFPVPLK